MMIGFRGRSIDFRRIEEQVQAAREEREKSIERERTAPFVRESVATPPRTTPDLPRYVYGLAAPSLNRVKIGTTLYVRSRIDNFQSACPAPLSLQWLLPGGVELEQSLHKEFRPLRVLGEWFVPGECDGCPTKLPPRRKRWCSDACSQRHHLAYLVQHDWGMARDAALQRDGRRCRRCGSNGMAPAEERAALWRSFEHEIATADDARTCRHRIDEAASAMRMLLMQYQLEVNHIFPRRGRGYANSCAHHLENLETLCRQCHQMVTNVQRMQLIGVTE